MPIINRLVCANCRILLSLGQICCIFAVFNFLFANGTNNYLCTISYSTVGINDKIFLNLSIAFGMR